MLGKNVYCITASNEKKDRKNIPKTTNGEKLLKKEYIRN